MLLRTPRTPDVALSASVSGVEPLKFETVRPMGGRFVHSKMPFWGQSAGSRGTLLAHIGVRKGVSKCTHQPSKRVIWALDPFGDNTPALKQMETILNLFASAGAEEIVPVFVLSPTNAHVPAEPFQQVEEAFRVLADKKMKELSQTFEVVQLKEPIVLVTGVRSLWDAASILSNHATNAGADVIVINTHARKGLARWFLGSFTETLILQNRVPVLTINPECEVRKMVSRILFPSDFEPRYREAFESAVNLARGFQAELILYHKQPFVEDIYLRGQVMEYMRRETLHRTERAYQWKEWAMAQGVRTELILDDLPGVLLDAILEVTEEKDIDIVVMASKVESPIAAAAGSLARQVVRQSYCPVWLINTKHQEVL